MADTFKSDWKVLSGSSDDFGFTVKPSVSNGGITASDFHQWEKDYVDSVDAGASCGSLAVDTTGGIDINEEIKEGWEKISGMIAAIDGAFSTNKYWSQIRETVKAIQTIGDTLTATDKLELVSILLNLLFDVALQFEIDASLETELDLQLWEQLKALEDTKRATDFAVKQGAAVNALLLFLVDILQAMEPLYWISVFANWLKSILGFTDKQAYDWMVSQGLLPHIDLFDPHFP